MAIDIENCLRIGLMPGSTQAVEIVERKGLGHPDSICDALAESASLALCRLYRDHCGTILHHNVDKALLWAGEAEPAFGGGRITAPIEIFLAGRATRRYRGADLPVEEAVAEAARAWLRANLRALDADRHVRLHVLLRPSAENLVHLFPRQRQGDAILANDTSCGAGYAPLSALETAVHAIAHHLNGPEMKAAHPEIGEDIKVMGMRRGRGMHFTVAVAFIGAHVADAADYLRKKSTVRETARAVAAAGVRAGGGAGDGGADVSVEVNAADAPPERVYLTVTGTSAESGDDGGTGRGNRANGLITPYRPMTVESLAGKNPVNHVGKLYNLAAGLIAEEMVRGIEGVEAAECFLVSRIGHPIAEPAIVDVRFRPAAGVYASRLGPRIGEVVAGHLDRLDRLAEDLIAGRLGFDRWPLPIEARAKAGLA